MDLIIGIGAKIYLNFSVINIAMIRGINNTINTTLYYTSGTGQVINAGTVFTYSGNGQTITLTFPNTTTFVGSGNTNIVIESTPTSTAPDLTFNQMYDGSVITINVDYNSNPAINDINILNIQNRYYHDFTIFEVETQYSDFDGDSLNAIRINGNVINYYYNQGTVSVPNYQPYISGTWISRANIPKLRYQAPNQDGVYTQTNQWEARDSITSISNMANINIQVSEFECVDPVIVTATYTGTPYILNLSWTTVSDYYQSFYPDIAVLVGIEVYEPNLDTLIFSGYIPGIVPFNTTNYQFDLYDYVVTDISKCRVTISIELKTSTCDRITSHIFPPNTLI